jgi:hypothetical protein
VLYRHELGLVPITTPAYSPESNGLAEAFVGTFKRDYLGDTELRDAETVLAQLGGWFDDYPGAALGARDAQSPRVSSADAHDRVGCHTDVDGSAAFAPGHAIDRGAAISVPPENGVAGGPCEPLT